MAAPSALNMTRSGLPTTRERACIELLYSQALTTPWLASMVSTLNGAQENSTDLRDTMLACQDSAVGWTRGLLIQAAVIDLLTYGDFPPDIDDRGVAESIRTAFSNFVSGQTLNQLDNRTAPFHDSQFYLRVWWSLDSSTTGQSAQTRTVNPALDASELDTAGQAGGPEPPLSMSGLDMLTRAANHTSIPDMPTENVSQQQREEATKVSQGAEPVRPSTSSAAKGSTRGAAQSTQSNTLCRSRSSSGTSAQGLSLTNQNQQQLPTALEALPSTPSSERTTQISDDEDEQAQTASASPQAVDKSDGGSPSSPAPPPKAGKAGGKGKKKSSKGRATRARKTRENGNDDDALEGMDEAEFRKKVQSVFHLPISDAAHALSVGVTVLKKQCRKINIPRWPYRKLASIEKLIESVEKVMNEEDDSVGKAAVEELLELRKKIFEDPSLELDDQTKRLRQANFKQQYKLRQERSCTELTEVEHEALMACGVVEVLGDIEIENAVVAENAAAPVAHAPAPVWNRPLMTGIRALPSDSIGDAVEGLFVTENDNRNAQQNKCKPPARVKSPERQAERSAVQPSGNDAELPLAARRARRSTKQRRYHLSNSDEAEDETPQGTAQQLDHALHESQPRSIPDYAAVCRHGMLPQIGMLPNMAPQLYLQGMPGAQQLPDYYSLTHDRFAADMLGPCGPLPLLHDQIYMQGTAQGMPAWQGQVPMDPGLGQHSILNAGGAAGMHDARAPMSSRNLFRSSVRPGELDDILRVAPLGVMPHQNTRHC